MGVPVTRSFGDRAVFVNETLLIGLLAVVEFTRCFLRRLPVEFLAKRAAIGDPRALNPRSRGYPCVVVKLADETAAARQMLDATRHHVESGCHARLTQRRPRGRW